MARTRITLKTIFQHLDHVAELTDREDEADGLGSLWFWNSPHITYPLESLHVAITGIIPLFIGQRKAFHDHCCVRFLLT